MVAVFGVHLELIRPDLLLDRECALAASSLRVAAAAAPDGARCRSGAAFAVCPAVVVVVRRRCVELQEAADEGAEEGCAGGDDADV